jgi:glycine oxidase
VGSHASGFAYGGVGSPGEQTPSFPIASEGARLHLELSKALKEETGISVEYRRRASLSLSFTGDEALDAEEDLAPRRNKGQSVGWLDGEEVRRIEPRISSEARGGVYIEGTADVEPYRLVLALAQAAESMGSTIRHGLVTGLLRDGSRVRGVSLDNGEISCRNVVLATGPWSGQASGWLGVPVRVRPLKGQILRLRAPGAPYRCSIGWRGNYATTKPDGLVWAGTTEEDVGFDEIPTAQARDQIMASLLKMLPSLSEAQLVRQTACLRPLSSDGLLLLGRVPGWDGVYIATGGLRSGIALGPAMGRITADLIVNGTTSIPIDDFDPGRFAKAAEGRIA